MELDMTEPETEHEENGFVDPRVLLQAGSLDIPDASSESSLFSEAPQEGSNMPSSRLWRPTGCCYDDRMKLHANADFSASPHHPEDPRRIEAIMNEFKSSGLIFQGTDSELMRILKTSPTQFMHRISARAATEAEICTCHTATHYHWVKNLSTLTSAELRAKSLQMDQGKRSLYVGNLSYEAALISAGGAIETCKNVVAGVVKNAIAVIRPPGHHAEAKEAMGFCLFNNVPIAAKICQIEYPEVCRKILILDWDVHHGNGVQNIFYEDPNVLYISIHVYDDGNFYPGAPDDPSLADGGLDSCGVGVGIGKNINIGWSDQGMGDGEYMAAFQKIVMPVAQEFDPDFVIVSAGFDAAAGDDLGGCFVTPACYAHMTHMLMSLAGGKLAVCLEGGYNLRAISTSALAVARTLMGEPPDRIAIPPINRDAALVLNRVMELQAPFWECMRAGKLDVRDVRNPGSVRQDIVNRAYQKKTLAQEHKMISLYVQREKLSRSFEDQILVTQNLHTAEKILLIIHDPAELLAAPDPVNLRVEPHNAWLVDGVRPYLDWAIARGFGILDVNIPMFISSVPDQHSAWAERPSEAEQQERIKELVCYLWDNYLEIYDTQNIVLMGVGDSYIGVKMLLTSRDSRPRITSILSFVSGSLRPVKSETDGELSSWYKNHSRIYVASDHACWENEEYERRVKKSRFGKVVRSSETSVNRMLATHFGDATSYIAESVGLEEEEEEEDEVNGADEREGRMTGVRIGGMF